MHGAHAGIKLGRGFPPALPQCRASARTARREAAILRAPGAVEMEAAAAEHKEAQERPLPPPAPELVDLRRIAP